MSGDVLAPASTATPSIGTLQSRTDRRFCGSANCAASSRCRRSVATMRAALTVYGNRDRGEAIRFEVYDPASCVRYTQAGPGASFESGKQVGSPSDPTTIFAVPPSQADGVTLLAGWTWFSLPWVPADASVDAVLRGVPAAGGDRIEGTTASGQQAFAQYDARQRRVDRLADRSGTGQGLQALPEPAGVPATPTSPVLPDVSQIGRSIPGWNWIGYLPGCSAPVSHGPRRPVQRADDGRPAQEPARLLGLRSGRGWMVRKPEAMTPGDGYQLRVARAEVSPFRRASSRTAGAAAPVIARSHRQSVALVGRELRRSPIEMTLVVDVPSLDAASAGSVGYEIVALVDDGSDEPNVRGVAPVRYDHRWIATSPTSPLVVWARAARPSRCGWAASARPKRSTSRRTERSSRPARHPSRSRSSRTRRRARRAARSPSTASR